MLIHSLVLYMSEKMWQVGCWYQTRLYLFCLHIQAYKLRLSPISFNSVFSLKKAVRFWITICQFLLRIIRKTTLVLKRLFLTGGSNFHDLSPTSKWCILPGQASLGMDIYNRTVDLSCWSWSMKSKLLKVLEDSEQDTHSSSRSEKKNENGYIWRPVYRIQGIIYSQLNFVDQRILASHVNYTLD